MTNHSSSASPFVDDAVQPRQVVARPAVAFVLEMPFLGESDGSVRAEQAFARELYTSLEDRESRRRSRSWPRTSARACPRPPM